MREHLIGIFPGEGIGPEVSHCAVAVLRAIESCCEGEHRFTIREGGAIGKEAIARHGSPLGADASSFCRQIFDEGGAVLAGPGGDRFVYECRRQFNLFYKLNPLRPTAVPLAARRIKPQFLQGVDILVVRENLAGIYQGEWHTSHSSDGVASAHQTFSYSQTQIEQVAHVACDLARRRRGHLTIVTKPNGIPAISQLWLQTLRTLSEPYGIRLSELEVDYASFALIQNPAQFDVIVTSNLFGDILADIGGILLGSRGLCHGGSFGADGAAIYQTNHGAAFDIAGTDTANPVGHLYALAMLLEHSLGLVTQARWILRAIETVWQEGWRTTDLCEPGCITLGTRAMGHQITAALQRHAEIPART